MQDTSNTESSRVVRVFISSTFRDMMKERDLLVKEVFPDLRKKCAKRFVTFTEVDLRWGITDEQANEGKVLPLCIAEIERCRPYFIGLLGERYGFIPDDIRPEAIEKEPWLKEHIVSRKSITELEFLYGMLNKPTMQSQAFFYFRDPSYANDPSLCAEERFEINEHITNAEVEQFGDVEAQRRSDERKAKLFALKNVIRSSGFPLVEPYTNPSELAELVRQQLNKLIDELYPEDEVLDSLVIERLAHAAYAENKLFACIKRPQHLAVLNSFASQNESGGKGLIITGESGGGKTVLLAAWAHDWIRNHKQDFLFQHYFGATPDSNSPDRFLHRLLAELKNYFKISEKIPTDPEKLREILPIWLAQTKGQSRVILVLDGLNQIQGNDLDHRLQFLFRDFPSNVVVIASAISVVEVASPLWGHVLNHGLNRGWVIYDLPKATEAEVSDMTSEYLKIHARALESRLLNKIVMAPGPRNPLFLRTFLEELRQFGKFEGIQQRIRHYLEAVNPKELFLKVLIRWQEDFDVKDQESKSSNGDLVGRSVTYLWAARHGLSESEWLDILGDGKLPLPRRFWTGLFLSIEPHLSMHNGLFSFGHNFLRQAVEELFVCSNDSKNQAHISLSDYFNLHIHQQEMTSRKATEWPYQLHAAKNWNQLKDCLINDALLSTLCSNKGAWEITYYWHSLVDKGFVHIRVKARDKPGAMKIISEILNDAKMTISLMFSVISDFGNYTLADVLVYNSNNCDYLNDAQLRRKLRKRFMKSEYKINYDFEVVFPDISKNQLRSYSSSEPYIII